MSEKILIAGNSAIDKIKGNIQVHLESTPINHCLELAEGISDKVKIIIPFDMPPYLKKSEIYDLKPNTSEWDNPVKPLAHLKPEIREKIPYNNENIFVIDEATAKNRNFAVDKMLTKKYEALKHENKNNEALFLKYLQQKILREKEVFEKDMKVFNCEGITTAMALNVMRTIQDKENAHIKWIYGGNSNRIELRHMLTTQKIMKVLGYDFSFDYVMLKKEEIGNNEGCSI